MRLPVASAKPAFFENPAGRVVTVFAAATVAVDRFGAQTFRVVGERANVIGTDIRVEIGSARRVERIESLFDGQAFIEERVTFFNDSIQFVVNPRRNVAAGIL